MIKNILQYIKLFNGQNEEYQDAQILRLAKVEHAKDWQYAYHMYINGKTPYTEEKLLLLNNNNF